MEGTRTVAEDVAADEATGGVGEQGLPLRTRPRDDRGGRRSRGRDGAGRPPRIFIAVVATLTAAWDFAGGGVVGDRRRGRSHATAVEVVVPMDDGLAGRPGGNRCRVRGRVNSRGPVNGRGGVAAYEAAGVSRRGRQRGPLLQMRRPRGSSPPP